MKSGLLEWSFNFCIYHQTNLAFKMSSDQTTVTKTDSVVDGTQHVDSKKGVKRLSSKDKVGEEAQKATVPADASPKKQSFADMATKLAKAPEQPVAQQKNKSKGEHKGEHKVQTVTASSEPISMPRGPHASKPAPKKVTKPITKQRDARVPRESKSSGLNSKGGQMLASLANEIGELRLENRKVFHCGLDHLLVGLHLAVSRVDIATSFGKKFHEIPDMLLNLFTELLSFRKWSKTVMAYDSTLGMEMHNGIWGSFDSRDFPGYMRKMAFVANGDMDLRYAVNKGITVMIDAVVRHLRVWEEYIRKYDWDGRASDITPELNKRLERIVKLLPEQEEEHLKRRKRRSRDEDDEDDDDDDEYEEFVIKIEPWTKRASLLLHEATEQGRAEATQRRADRNSSSRQ